MSPAAIQRRAGVGQGSMYHHFAGKAELAQVAIERSADQLLAAAEQALSGAGSPVQRVAGYLERERDPLLGCPVGRLAQDREVIGDKRLRALVASMFVTLEQRIRAVLAEDESLPAPDELAAAVLAMLQGGYVLARAGGDRAPFDRAIAGAIRLLNASTKETADGYR